mmetsp:Transcript_46434/g.140618  ORF Transcript_46434/g.140618 Transcript_46434/m.140618 type:complete len:235 (+) Transcript_46434:1354-2058(+)
MPPLDELPRYEKARRQVRLLLRLMSAMEANVPVVRCPPWCLQLLLLPPRRRPVPTLDQIPRHEKARRLVRLLLWLMPAEGGIPPAVRHPLQYPQLYLSLPRRQPMPLLVHLPCHEMAWRWERKSLQLPLNHSANEPPPWRPSMHRWHPLCQWNRTLIVMTAVRVAASRATRTLCNPCLWKCPTPSRGAGGLHRAQDRHPLLTSMISRSAVRPLVDRGSPHPSRGAEGRWAVSAE